MQIKREEPSPEVLLERLCQEYEDAKQFAAKAAEQADWLKQKLNAELLAHGQPDHKGSLWLSTSRHDLKRERRVTDVLNRDAVEEWAKANGLWGQVSEVVESLSEEKLLTLAWERQDLAPTIQGFYSQKEVWAFKLTDRRQHRVEE